MDQRLNDTQAAERDEQGEQARAPEIDIERLADRVYRLMLAEVRLERSRGERPPGRRRF